RSSGSQDGSEAGASSNPLDAYASNLNELARQGRIDPLVGREHEVERVAGRQRGGCFQQSSGRLCQQPERAGPAGA
ncbi:hypothetical protein C6968_27425, partial [Escherichia coli]